jgi:hypothetical protein
MVMQFLKVFGHLVAELRDTQFNVREVIVRNLVNLCEELFPRGLKPPYESEDDGDNGKKLNVGVGGGEYIEQCGVWNLEHLNSAPPVVD